MLESWSCDLRGAYGNITIHEGNFTIYVIIHLSILKLSYSIIYTVSITEHLVYVILLYHMLGLQG